MTDHGPEIQGVLFSKEGNRMDGMEGGKKEEVRQDCGKYNCI